MQGYNFTTRVRRALQNARAEASRLGHEFVGTEHMLLGVLLDADSIATMALRNLGIDPVQLRARIEETVKRGPAGQQESRKLPYTPRAKRILELAMKEAQDKQVGYVSTEHLLLGIIREERGVAAQVLVERGATLDSARAEVTRLVRERGIESRRSRPRTAAAIARCSRGSPSTSSRTSAMRSARRCGAGRWPISS